jgi:MFS family permease
MAAFEPSDSLRDRTFLGLLAAQFLAAFNDQAIHASAMFFAINTKTLNEAQAINLMPILFYAPWALFCTAAGYFADRYSKRTSLVFWKVAEVGITLLALAGFWLGRNGSPAGPWLVLAAVFLMGTHSAFFVPAKYGAMPEILRSDLLSRGNGLLESLSFLGVILGTVAGGVLSEAFGGQEYCIGVLLVGLAVLGVFASLLIRRMPAANPTRSFPPYLYKPLWQNIPALLRSRPLAFAVVGIAFFTFLVAYMRATVYMHGETQVHRWGEAKTSLVVGMVALGIGIGSPLVGFLSGRKIELGLVPIGAVGMVVATLVAAAYLGRLTTLVVCITAIGFFTGFYLVPLFTLLQYRAPKTSKGDAVATSNFINVTGAIAASALLFVLELAAQKTGVTPELPQREEVQGVLRRVSYTHGRPSRVSINVDDVRRVFRADEEGPEPVVIEVDEDDLIDALSPGVKRGDRVVVTRYQLGDVTHHRVRRATEPQRPVYNNSGLPRLLFAGAGLMTLLTLLLLWRLLPGLFLRTFLWLHSLRSFRLELAGMSRLPGDSPVILATDAEDAEACLRILAATDRATRFLMPGPEQAGGAPRWLVRWAAWSGLGQWEDSETLAARASRALERGEVVALPLGDGKVSEAAERLLERLTRERSIAVLPVVEKTVPASAPWRRPLAWVVAGELLPAGTTADRVRKELQRLGNDLRRPAVGHAAWATLSGVH